MTDARSFEPGPAFELIEPSRRLTPLVFNSPHSGSHYPRSFLGLSRLDRTAIRQSEDSHVDELFLAAVDHGAPLLRARFPRAWLDVNREPFELDPKMFRGTLPSFANTKSARVTSGLGTIPRIVADGKAIYLAPLPVAEGLSRIEEVYVPYHRLLRRTIDTTRQTFGFSVLIDCHSMPSTTRSAHFRGRPDFVLGDRHGSSCSPLLTSAIEGALVGLGYDVSRNRPYAGGFITEHYGKPKDGTHAIQIEINRSLYLSERTLEKKKNFARLRADLSSLIGSLVGACNDIADCQRDAAE